MLSGYNYKHRGDKISGTFGESCGVFGIFGHKEAVKLAYLGLYALQHRGQESAGIATSNGKDLKVYKGMGLVSEVFKDGVFKNLMGHMAIGHVRYSTAGSSQFKNAQPFWVEYSRGKIAVVHNGNLVNVVELRKDLEQEGAIFQSTMDSEIIIHLIAHSKEKKFKDALIQALSKVKGSYSLIFLNKDQIIGVRDPYGFKPLCLGFLKGAYILASETCALDIIQAKYIREIEPGEIIIIDREGIKSIKPFPQKKHSFCIFEFIYFARPDSNIFGKNVYLTRKRLGNRLSKESPVKADMVMPVPDSGNYAALGFAQANEIPFEMGIIRNHYIGRTFIQPSELVRALGVKIKLNPVKEVLKDKRIALIEDSIVRGTTSQTRIKTLWEAGAKEIHMRVSCPPLKFPCFYGIDFPTKDELIASTCTIKQISKRLRLNSLNYLSLQGMLSSMPLPPEEFCTACFNGKYPIPVGRKLSKYSLEIKKE